MAKAAGDRYPWMWYPKDRKALRHAGPHPSFKVASIKERVSDYPCQWGG
jgi:hypothetical protein